MQCFTRGHKYPRTTPWNDYRVPPLEAYNTRQPFKPEPTIIGRPWCPGAFALPPPWAEHMKRLQYNPVDHVHREKHMSEMLEHINKVNWTCGGDMECLGPRKSKASDSIKYSLLQTTVRDDYRNPGLGTPPLRNPVRGSPSQGATPATYHLVPYKSPNEHWLVLPIHLDPPEPPFDPYTSCKVTTVPHYTPDPYPGTPLPPGYTSKVSERPTVSVRNMALVQ